MEMSPRRKLTQGAILGILTTAAFTFSVPAQASDAGAFLGGMVTSRILGSIHRSTVAQEQQAQAAQAQAAAAQQRPVPQAAPAPKQSAQQKLQELDKLAAGGYITPAEYKAKKQAILDSM
jgi:hypothetical protein